jgi:hypothetical protein
VYPDLPGRKKRGIDLLIAVKNSLARMVLGVGFACTITLPCGAQVCSSPVSTYEGYTVRKIELRHPLSFVFLVHRSLEELKQTLPLKEGQPFSSKAYGDSSDIVFHSIKSDDSFGLSLVKVVAVTDGLENCSDSPRRMLDVVFRIFSSDPIPVIEAPAEQNREAANEPATTVAEQTTAAGYKIKPVLGYDDSRQTYGGAQFVFKVPARIFQNGNLFATASQRSWIIQFQLERSARPKRALLDQMEYAVSYNNNKTPSSNITINQGTFQGRFMATSRPREGSGSRSLARYGASVVVGNQHSDLRGKTPPPGTIVNSSYGAVRIYGGLTRTTRMSEAIVSYGFQLGGTNLGKASFAKNLVDAAWSRRFPAHTHSPWDIQARFSAGAIRGKQIALTDRFFGGATVKPFIDGENWFIPNGPTVRSIPSNQFSVEGFGGTSFVSSNLTLGKVIFFRPMIPREIQNADGFESAIESGENTAEGFFYDTYLALTPEYKALITRHSQNLKTDLDGINTAFQSIESQDALKPAAQKILTDAELLLRQAQRVIRHATVPDENGNTNPQGLITLLNTKSPIVKQGNPPGLLLLLPKIEDFATPGISATLSDAALNLKEHLSNFRTEMDNLKSQPAGQLAAAKAREDMARPREIIDSLQREINRYAFGVAGIFDVARMWPDPERRTRYAVGASGRFSLLNVNLSIGYAFNPHPDKKFGEGRGAIVLALTYTNLFR